MFTKTLIAVSLAASALISTSAFALEKVDLLIKNATVLTMDKDRTVFEQGLIAVKGKQIIAVTDGKDVENYQAKTSIDAEGVPNRQYRYIVHIGAQLGNVEMLKGGVTTYADMYYFEDEVARTVDKNGMRAVLGETVIQFPVAYAENAEEGIQYAPNFIEEYEDHPRITPAFAPHAPYTNSTEILQKVTELSLQHNVPVMIHLAESDREIEVIAERSGGKSPVAYMADKRQACRYYRD